MYLPSQCELGLEGIQSSKLACGMLIFKTWWTPIVSNILYGDRFGEQNGQGHRVAENFTTSLQNTSVNS